MGERGCEGVWASEAVGVWVSEAVGVSEIVRVYT